MTTTSSPGPTRNPEVFVINPRLGLVTPRAPAASREDSCPQPSSNYSFATALITESARSPSSTFALLMGEK